MDFVQVPGKREHGGDEDGGVAEPEEGFIEFGKHVDSGIR